MATLLVRNFGPIVNSGQVVINIHKVSVFCGTQGAGKSTISKLISEFSWFEKALSRGDFLTTELTNYDRFRKKYCAYHNLQNYFHDDTYILFEGDKYRFEYKEKHFSVEMVNGHDYKRPQIIYIPAERNFMASLEDADKVRRMPGSIVSMTGDYQKALRDSKGVIDLPISGYSVQYDKLNKVTWLVKNGDKIRVQETASGFQSLIPLVVVSKYLLNTIVGKDVVKKAESSDDIERIQKTIQSLLKDSSLTEDVRRALILELNAGQKNQRFINIVEEPEQNLYPASQRSVLYELLKINNTLSDNKLIITTHSPYIISYLCLAVKANNLLSENISDFAKTKLSEIVPLECTIKGSDLAIYELSEDGEIAILPNYKGMPDDDNMLNMALADTADLYEQLVDIEESCRS